MLASRAMAAVVALLVAVCFLVVPSSAQTCLGSAVSVGPPLVPSYNLYYVPTTLTATQRTLTVTTQVKQLQMFVYYSVNANNTSPINISLALYAFQPCNGFGEAVLLAVSQTYTFPVNSLTATSGFVMTLSLPTPIIVPAGVYYVSMDDTSANLDPLFGNSSATGAAVLYDVYTGNSYDQTAPVAFPASTLFLPVFGGYDSEATIIGTQCTGGEMSATFPTCNPRLFGSYPSTYSASSLPCAASSQVIGGSEYDPTYTSLGGLATDVIRLIPSDITQTQTLYAVSFIASPQSNTSQTYTMRPAVYVQGANSSTFNLIAQAAQTTIPGSALAGNFVELFFPLLTPVNVTAGQTVYINRLVDQAGLVLLFSSTGGTFTSSTTVTSAQPAPAVLTTQGTGGLDAAHATLGCAVAGASSAPTCLGSAVAVGPPIVPSYNTYFTFSTLFGSQRTLSSTTLVRQLQMFVYYTVNTNNTYPITVSFALYAFQPCNGFGEAVLLAVTQSYTFPANSLTATGGYVLTLSLPTPLIVPAGTYYISMDDNSPSLDPLFGTSTATGAAVLYDVYTANTYNQSAPVAFPASTLFLPYFGGYDTEATIIGSSCTGGEVPAPFPACNPRLFGSYPSTYNASSLPCAASSQVIGGSEYDPTYTSIVGLATDVIRLIPSDITQTQTLYAVSFIASPASNTSQTYTMRPAVYVQGANSSTFILIAQAAQTTIPGSALAGNYVELFFPLLTPVNVTAGQVVYINRLVDQAGLVLLFSSTGGTFTSSTTVTSAQSAPAVLTTQGTGGIDASHATFGCAAPQPAAVTSTGYLCLITYTLPGSLDYPASVATSLSVTYNPTAVSTSSGTAVQLVSGSGVRTFTDRFGDAHISTVTLNTAASSLLYLQSSLPVDSTGLTFTTGTPVQLPGGNPSRLYSQLNVYNATGGILLEQGSGRVDKAGQAYLSNIPGFRNVTIGASNLNALAPNYVTCAAPVTFTNGLRPFIEGNANNGAQHFNYSYVISDGATYTVRTTLSISSSTAFATLTDTLGNNYQPVIGVFGTRVYTHTASGQTLTSTITGLTSATSRPVSQHWYPYSLLVASPGVYSLNTVPFLDADGIGFTVSPAVPANGQPLTSTLSSTVSVFVTSSTPTSTAAVTEYTAAAGNPPSIDQQQQTYVLNAF